ncbi:insulinase family protein [Fulvivirga sp. M361]|uniref:M16 family metallopeptidase n=1 Tax=Fulvivirga sp. M361 TaxID=2594266 RepID=UPI00117B9D7C|nr:M16 family metallopeptidase [Fulvivirga sp. M361]TRX61822.1 insulinase family protein [Fulvivirga sp. M361]
MISVKTIILALLLVGVNNLEAQTTSFGENNLNSPIPIDPTIKMGKLDNGLTYYIKKNTKPEHRAELRLVVNAGSILEDEDQLGLAHFVEHMAFNGTRSFEKNELISYLQSLGVEFGADLNAHTSFDETVYKLSVPTDDEQTFNTSLQILRDWSDGITFSEEEIDNERGVVAEELRARSGAGMRMYYQSIPILTNNSRYADRSPIGTLDVIMNSKYEALTRFYKDWYRPDLMALILVGDFDVASVETKVKTLFKDLKSVKNARERVHYTIPGHNDSKIGVITDTEATRVSFSVYHKQSGHEQNTLNDYRQHLVHRLYAGMLRQRMSEMLLLPDAPLLAASAGIGDFLSNMDSYYLRATLKEDEILPGIEALLTEGERAKRYGFTQSELDRYKAVLLNNTKTYYKEAGKISSRYYVEQYTDHFMDNKPIVGEAFNYEFYKGMLPGITLTEVNKVASDWVGENNISAILSAPLKESLKLPDEKEINDLLNTISTKKIDKYEDSLGDVQLMTKKPTPGEIVETNYNEKVNVTTWKLSNGVTVIVKPTELQNDLISMSGFRPGGSSQAPDSIFVSAYYASNIVGASGINGISTTDLKKLNMGKTVSARPIINYYDDLFSGSSSEANLERMLQMTHLYFTAPNKDENVFDAKKATTASLMKNMESSPGAYFSMKVRETMSNNHLRGISMTEGQINNELMLDQAYGFYKDRFSSANGFTFIFVGSFDVDKVKNLTTQYLGSLPSNMQETSSWKDIGLRYAEGSIKKTIVKGVEEKSQVDLQFVGKLDFSLEKKNQLSLLAKLLKIKLTEEMREKMAGVYGVRVSGFASDRPYDWYRMQVAFTCAPENVDALTDKVLEEIEKLKTETISEEDLNKIKEAELTNAEEGLKYNGYWVSKLKTAHEYGLDPAKILDYEADINRLTAEDFKEAANIYFKKEHATFILMPEEKVETPDYKLEEKY